MRATDGITVAMIISVEPKFPLEFEEFAADWVTAALFRAELFSFPLTSQSMWYVEA